MYVKLLILVLFSFSAYAEEECQIPGTPFQEIQNILSAARNNCVEIPKGAFRIQHTESGRAEHLLERDTNGNYRATFNIEFRPQRGITTTPEFMKNKMNACFQMVAPYLKGPDGNTLTFRILSSPEADALPRNQKPRRFRIAVGPEGSRSDTRMFSSDDDCATFTHEMLHHLGLQDEYRETSAELAPKWNCRPLTRRDSVMNSHTSGLDAAVPRTVMCACSSSACQNLIAHPDEAVIRTLTSAPGWPLSQDYQRANCATNYSFLPQGTPEKDGLEVVSDNGDNFVTRYQWFHPDDAKRRYVRTVMTLTCTCRDDACRREKTQMLAKIGQTPAANPFCPQGMREVSRDFAPGTYQTGIHNGMLRFSTTPTRSTILYPNQFRRAVSGTCEENIAGYGMCSEYAYTGSRNGQCKTPAECRNPDYYIGPTPQ